MGTRGTSSRGVHRRIAHCIDLSLEKNDFECTYSYEKSFFFSILVIYFEIVSSTFFYLKSFKKSSIIL
jgi:hypothetical protein